MTNVVNFRQHRRTSAPRRAKPRHATLKSYGGLIALGLMMAAAAISQSSALVPSGLIGPFTEGSRTHQQFSICGFGSRTNCVVDGDTFYFNGEKIRVADINTPEVSVPQCARERELGKEATRRFQTLLNAGPIELRRVDRDEDRHGRKLRTVHRGGRSLGDMLVTEGLAHRWIGHKQSWCSA